MLEELACMVLIKNPEINSALAMQVSLGGRWLNLFRSGVHPMWALL
jgi:hypothetical protein